MKLNWFRSKAPVPADEQKTPQFESILRRLVMSQAGQLGGGITPDNCEQAPTVKAIVTAIARRISSTPVHVYEKSIVNGKEIKKALPDHPVAQLLARPNSWQTPVEFWLDATSTLVRWGRFHSYKSGAANGRVMELLPLPPREVTLEQDSKTWKVVYKIGDSKRPGSRTEPPNKMFCVRGPARDFVTGDSPVSDVKVAIALEVLSEKFGAAFFQNGAMPLLVFMFAEGSAGFQTKEQEEQFISDIEDKFGGDNILRTMLVPKGIQKPEPIAMEHDKAQFIETRKLQRTIIAGAFGVPPHLVGDLDRGTFNNVEQQSEDFTLNVVMPIVRCFESAMERDLLSENDRRSNRVVRFNLDSVLRAAFKDRQEGLQIQRQNGIISANEWREREGYNPRDDDHGDDYIHPANMVVDGEVVSNESPANSPPPNQGTQ